jgi:hypothetical protein
MKERRPLALPSDGAREIVEICKANLMEPNTVNRDKYTPGSYTDMEIANRAYYEANQGSYEGFQAALRHGTEQGMLKVHASGTRILHIMPPSDALSHRYQPLFRAVMRFQALTAGMARTPSKAGLASV